jgi:hypothetical protein
VAVSAPARRPLQQLVVGPLVRVPLVRLLAPWRPVPPLLVASRQALLPEPLPLQPMLHAALGAALGAGLPPAEAARA